MLTEVHKSPKRLKCKSLFWVSYNSVKKKSLVSLQNKNIFQEKDYKHHFLIGHIQKHLTCPLTTLIKRNLCLQTKNKRPRRWSYNSAPLTMMFEVLISCFSPRREPSHRLLGHSVLKPCHPHSVRAHTS